MREGNVNEVVFGSAMGTLVYESTVPVELSFATGDPLTNVCLSSSSGGAPDLGSAPIVLLGTTTSDKDSVASTISIAQRDATSPGQMSVSYGVVTGEKTSSNTLDLTGTAFAITDQWAELINWMVANSFDVARMHVFGPGIVRERLGARVEWVYSAPGEVYLWWPLPASAFFSQHLMSPRIVRSNMHTTSGYCIWPNEFTLSGSTAEVEDSVCKEVDAILSPDNVVYATFEDAIPKPVNHTRHVLMQMRSLTAPSSSIWGFSVADFAIVDMASALRMFNLEATGNVLTTEFTTADDGMDAPSSIASTEGAFFSFSMYFIGSIGALASTILLQVKYNGWKKKYIRRNGRKHFGDEVWDNPGLRKKARTNVTVFFFLQHILYTEPAGDFVLESKGIFQCMFMAVFHFVIFMMGPLMLFFFATNLYITDTEQCCCAWEDALLGECVVAAKALPNLLYAVCFLSVGVMIIYSLCYYLRILDHKIPWKDRIALAKKMNVLLGCPLPLIIFAIIALSLVALLWLCLCLFLYPEQYISIFVGFLSIIFVCQKTYQAGMALRQDLKETILATQRVTQNAISSQNDVAEQLDKAGYSKEQVWLLTLSVAVSMVCVVTFLILGLTLWVGLDNVYSSLTGSAILLISAYQLTPKKAFSQTEKGSQVASIMKKLDQADKAKSGYKKTKKDILGKVPQDAKGVDVSLKGDGGEKPQ